MQEMVGKRHGKPHKMQSVEDGGETWTYFERAAERPASAARQEAAAVRPMS